MQTGKVYSRFMAEILLAAIDQKPGVIIFQDSADISMAHQV